MSRRKPVVLVNTSSWGLEHSLYLPLGKDLGPLVSTEERLKLHLKDMRSLKQAIKRARRDGKPYLYMIDEYNTAKAKALRCLEDL